MQLHLEAYISKLALFRTLPVILPAFFGTSVRAPVSTLVVLVADKQGILLVESC